MGQEGAFEFKSSDIIFYDNVYLIQNQTQIPTL